MNEVRVGLVLATANARCVARYAHGDCQCVTLYPDADGCISGVQVCINAVTQPLGERITRVLLVNPDDPTEVLGHINMKETATVNTSDILVAFDCPLRLPDAVLARQTSDQENA